MPWSNTANKQFGEAVKALSISSAKSGKLLSEINKNLVKKDGRHKMKAGKYNIEILVKGGEVAQVTYGDV
jgi:hypothetical protein